MWFCSPELKDFKGPLSSIETSSIESENEEDESSTIEGGVTGC